MSTLIVYGSCYGTSRQYAEQISQKTGYRCVSFTKGEDLKAYQRILYIGGLYMGHVLGLHQTARSLSPAQQLIVLTVGVSDTQNPQVAERIRSSVLDQLPAALQSSARVYHLSGRIDYARLSFSHRAILEMMMRRLCRMAKNECDQSAMALLYALRAASSASC